MTPTKQSLLNSIGEFLGTSYTVGVGSSLPKRLFEDAATFMGLAITGSMPKMAEAIVTSAGLVWDSSCDSRNTRSGGGSTVTATGLERLLKALSTYRALDSYSSNSTVGSNYRPQSGRRLHQTRAINVDWNYIDQQTERHMAVQNELAAAASIRGVTPLSPSTNDPLFDIAWEHNGMLVVVEIKTATGNHRQQVRLGIGQLLEYTAVLRQRKSRECIPVLALDVPPSELDRLVASAVGVRIVDATDVGHLETSNLLPRLTDAGR